MQGHPGIAYLLYHEAVIHQPAVRIIVTVQG